jgi:hypothetical protein
VCKVRVNHAYLTETCIVVKGNSDRGSSTDGSSELAEDFGRSLWLSRSLGLADGGWGCRGQTFITRVRLGRVRNRIGLFLLLWCKYSTVMCFTSLVAVVKQPKMRDGRRKMEEGRMKDDGR